MVLHDVDGQYRCEGRGLPRRWAMGAHAHGTRAIPGVWVVVVIMMLTTVSAACGKHTKPCGDHDDDLGDANAPRVNTFAFVRQMPSDPWDLVFSVNFSDADGDLGTVQTSPTTGQITAHGLADLYTGQSDPTVSWSLAELLPQSNISPTATSGVFAIPLRFSESLGDGSNVALQLQLIDMAGHRSNCYEVDLHVTLH